MLKTARISPMFIALKEILNKGNGMRNSDVRILKLCYSADRLYPERTAGTIAARPPKMCRNPLLSFDGAVVLSALTPTTKSFSHRRYFHASTTCAKRFRPAKIDESEESEDLLLEEEDDLTKGEKIMNVRLATDRLDAVIKAGFQLSRNKIEKALYADLIRLNGERPKKKSVLVGEGDEIDFVLRYNQANPAFLDVHRLRILFLGQWARTEEEDSDDEAKLPARIKRSKNLTIENYPVPVKGNIETI